MEAFPIADGKRTIRHLRSMVAISKTKNRDDTNSVTDCGLRLPDSGSMRYFIARVSRAPVEKSTTNAMLSIHGTDLCWFYEALCRSRLACTRGTVYHERDVEHPRDSVASGSSAGSCGCVSRKGDLLVDPLI